MHTAGLTLNRPYAKLQTSVHCCIALNRSFCFSTVKHLMRSLCKILCSVFLKIIPNYHAICLLLIENGLWTFRPLDVSPLHRTFRPQDVSPLDVSPPRRFAPWTFRHLDVSPQDISPPRRFATRTFHPWTFRHLDVSPPTVVVSPPSVDCSCSPPLVSCNFRNVHVVLR